MSTDPFEWAQTEPLHQENEEAQERELTHEEMREKLRDPSFLPSYDALAKYFEKFTGLDKDNDPEWKKWLDLAFNDEHPIFEIWTKEYIHAFGSYLAQRVEELGGTKENPTIILEVGAGNGRLTHFLQEKIDELLPGKVKIVASDSGKLKISPAFPVENIPHNEALATYKPKIVIFSWMPYRYDCTADFRAALSVDEYILIGEAGGRSCGDLWQTWGKFWSFDKEARERYENQPAPYEVDGFEKEYQSDLKDVQLSRINISAGESTSETVSFKRKNKNSTHTV